MGDGTNLDMVKYIRAGIPSSSIAEIAKPLHLTQMEVADILVIPQRTLARRKREGVFNQEESHKEFFTNCGAWIKTTINPALVDAIFFQLQGLEGA